VGGRGPQPNVTSMSSIKCSLRASGERAPCIGSKRKPHVTAAECRCKSAQGREFLYDGRHLGSQASFDLHGRTARVALAAGSGGFFCESGEVIESEAT